MFNVTLKDGSKIEFSEAVTLLEVAKTISDGLARVALCAEVDGVTCDLSYVLDKDAEVNVLTFDNQNGKDALRHTTSHVLAQAVKRLYPQAKLAIGPAIENGFYYDFDSDISFGTEQLAAIEGEMKKIVKENQKIVVYDLPSEATYEVVESEAAGFTSKATDADGSIRAGQAVQAAFVNEYKASGSVQLNVGKSLTGHAIRKNQFRFELVDNNPDSSTYGEVEVTMQANILDSLIEICVAYNPHL